MKKKMTKNNWVKIAKLHEVEFGYKFHKYSAKT